MSKCLITKLSGSVNNSSLLKIGEIRAFKKTGSKISPYSYITFRQSASFESLGSGLYRTDSFTEKYGQKYQLNDNEGLTFYIKPGEGISITDKYKLDRLDFIQCKADIDQFLYSKIKKLNLFDSDLDGNLENLVREGYLTDINVSGATKLSCDLSLFKGKENQYTSIVLNKIGRTDGNISIFNNFSKLSSLGVSKGATGDVSLLSNSVLVFMSSSDSNFTWSTERTGTKIMAISGFPNFGLDLDKVLLNLSKLDANTSGGASKEISVKGTRTSASSAAITTLQQKGYTVSVTPA